jgi:NhaP-type Na+/H+ or K+/H+ antiporter
MQVLRHSPLVATPLSAKRVASIAPVKADSGAGSGNSHALSAGAHSSRQFPFDEPEHSRRGSKAHGAPGNKSVGPSTPQESSNSSINAAGAAIGMPNKGIDSDVPLTVPEEGIKGNQGLLSVRGLAAAVVLPASTIYMWSIVVARFLGNSQYLNFIPDSVNIIGAALLLGMLIREAIMMGWLDLHEFTLVNSTVLNLFLLPIIIFSSGWSLNKGNFISQIEHIHVFAILGTLISTFVIGGSSYMLAQYGLHHVTDFRSNLIFGALISAVDPVATLATYAKLGLPKTQPLLHTLVFGESAINDAVAIVIFDVVNEGWDDLSLIHSTGQVSKLLFGSMFIGVIIASLLLVLMRKAGLQGDTAHEILYLHMSAYCIFAFAEAASFSGIIAGLFGGMLMGAYGPKLLTKDGARLANEFLEISGMSADTWVFILCGTSTALLNKQDGVIFGLIGVVLCLVGRAISVPCCATICNFFKRRFFTAPKTIITFAHQVMMWHGGLRGGIALVLALEIDATWCAFKGAILNATFLIICVLLLILGSTTEHLLIKLGLQPEGGTNETSEGADDKEEEDALWNESLYAAGLCMAIDPYIRPILVGHNEENMTPKFKT